MNPSQAWWCIPVVPARREAEAEGLRIEVSPRQNTMIVYLKNNLNQKGLGSWLK
jgi:hypothetical protein